MRDVKAGEIDLRFGFIFNNVHSFVDQLLDHFPVIMTVFDDLDLTPFANDEGDTAGANGFDCGDAKMLDLLGNKLFVYSVPRGVPIDGGSGVQGT